MKSLKDSFDSASPQTRGSYGKDYVNSLIEGLRECGKTTHPTLKPVMKAMEHAVTSTRPHGRYLIQGSNKWLDWYCVSFSVNNLSPFCIKLLWICVLLGPGKACCQIV